MVGVEASTELLSINTRFVLAEGLAGDCMLRSALRSSDRDWHMYAPRNDTI